jgi:hypothetical protein
MASRLWNMNADFEAELAAPAGAYRRPPHLKDLNRRLSEHLLWLARPGDALLVKEPWPERLRAEAGWRGVELMPPEGTARAGELIFTPWGWTPSAAAAGERAGATVWPVPFETVARVNSKLWSHALEVEMGAALPGAALAPTMEQLREAVARACPRPDDKWVVKSPLGFAARGRVLGRGPTLGEPQARWAERRMAGGETLIFQPWLDVVREYGIVMDVAPRGAVEVHGISDYQTNGAGVGKGYILARPPAPQRLGELERVAHFVGARLYAEGFQGPVGVDAVEHSGGLHPLLEINARHTMGFIALAVERSLKPSGPVFWSIK